MLSFINKVYFGDSMKEPVPKLLLTSIERVLLLDLYAVIDGQQRLTTVCIFLKAMSDILDTHVKIKDDKNDAFYYYTQEIKKILEKP